MTWRYILWMAIGGLIFGQSIANASVRLQVRLVADNNAMLQMEDPHWLRGNVKASGDYDQMSDRVPYNRWTMVFVADTQQQCGSLVRLVADNRGMLHRHPHNSNVGVWGKFGDLETYRSENLWRVACERNSPDICGTRIRLISSDNSMLHRHPHNSNVGGWGNHFKLGDRKRENLWTVKCSR